MTAQLRWIKFAFVGIDQEELQRPQFSMSGTNQLIQFP